MWCPSARSHRRFYASRFLWLRIGYSSIQASHNELEMFLVTPMIGEMLGTVSQSRKRGSPVVQTGCRRERSPFSVTNPQVAAISNRERSLNIDVGVLRILSVSRERLLPKAEQVTHLAVGTAGHAFLTGLSSSTKQLLVHSVQVSPIRFTRVLFPGLAHNNIGRVCVHKLYSKSCFG